MSTMFTRIKSLFQYLFSWRSFWVVIVSLGFSCILFIPLERSILFIENIKTVHWYISLLCGLLIVLIIGFVLFVVNPAKQLKVQSIHKQPSWVFYTYWGIVNFCLIWSLAMLVMGYQPRWYAIVGSTIALFILLFKWRNESILGQELNFKNFSSGAVGVENDELEFTVPAKNVAEGLKKINGYVNVAGLYGGFGFGKSSYARMIVENFDPQKTLYTYISLTETNEAQDFSKLFAERWMETLSTRYPKIDVASYLPFMDSILRESGNGIFSGFLKVISSFDRGLTKTKAFFFDDFYFNKAEIRKEFSSESVAKLFGNVSEFKEDSWIIMIDEVERAQFDEIYRLVEIIERFKSEGRSGVPVKLIFIICISEPHLEEYLETYKDNPLTHSLKTFFYEDPKSIAYRIFLPPVNPLVKQKYVLDKLNFIINREAIKVPSGINPNRIGDPSRTFTDDHKDALEYILSIVISSSPRIINRISIALDFFYGSFRDRFGESRKNSIRFSDVLALEYIKIRYPYLLVFFNQTIHTLVNREEVHNMDAYFTKEEIKDNKLDLIGWVEKVTGRKIHESEKKDILKIIGLVAYYYFDFLGNDYNTRSKNKYVGTTSYPEVMCDYLSLLDGGTTTSFRRNNDLFQRHKMASEGFVRSLENGELLSYARFIFGIQDAPVEINLDLVEEMSQRITTGKILLDPMNVENTSLYEASYQLTYQIVAIAEKDKNKETPTENFKKTFSALKSVLSSDRLPTGIKYLILSSLANNERGGGSTIHFRLERAFKKILTYYDLEMRGLIKSVFSEVEDRYLNGDKVLYEHEENFFWTLYQSWSGSKEALGEIEKIRKAAKRGLVNNITALRLYWRKYPSPVNKQWNEFKDVLEDDRFFSFEDTTNPIYMPLSDLISITRDSNIKDEEIGAKLKFWDHVKDDTKLKEMSVVKDEPSTLKSYLVRNNFL